MLSVRFWIVAFDVGPRGLLVPEEGGGERSDVEDDDGEDRMY